jgi:hypothetical protein
VGLPALVSAAGDGAPFTREERIEDCLWHGERTWECRETSLEVMVNSWRLRQAAKGTKFGPLASDPDTEAAFRQKRRDQLRRFHDESPEDRRVRCAADTDAAQAKGLPGLSRAKDAAWPARGSGQRRPDHLGDPTGRAPPHVRAGAQGSQPLLIGG